MIKDLTFKDVCKFIKEDDPKLLEKADNILGLVILLSSTGLSLFTSLPVAPILGLIGAKNELVKIGKNLYEQITKKKDVNSLDKLRRIEAAYTLICYTAFFETLDDLLEAYPVIKKELELNLSEKVKLVEKSSEKVQSTTPQYYQLVETSSTAFHEGRLFLPNPSESFQKTLSETNKLYLELKDGLSNLINLRRKSEFDYQDRINYTSSESKKTKQKTSEIIPFGFNNKKDLDRFVSQIEEIPQKALKNFEAQYYDLSSKYNEFYIWANLQEHKKTRKKLSEFINTYSAFANDLKKNIDVGLIKLAKTVESIPHLIEKSHAEEIFISLEKIYGKEVEQPVIKDTFTDKDEEVRLNFPKKSDIFVPQSFKVIFVGSNKQFSLEDKTTWSSIKSRNDLGAFLLNYLSSPYSSQAPLIILGHPGSGKSLLTQMLASKLTLPVYSPIRVELRNVNADNDIESQIEEQIRKDTGKVIKLIDYTKHLIDFPPVVILDGYDELLQASGKVFSGYPLKAQKLQERELNLGRPLRIIITSRITLIDKASIPFGATIIKLEEFDEDRRNKWISVWNNANMNYFNQKKMEPFSLPSKNVKILELAEQPLLLLMLALYDSEKNKLHKGKDIKQTELYYNLLRRFVQREIEKDVERFDKFSPKEKDVEIKKEIDKEIERLGVVALGMFNRRNLFISTNQLNKDLAYFKLEKEVKDTPDRKLQQAEFILGSFFFVHKAQSEYKGDSAGETGTETAFEFLHNTFGEFLTADFLLSNIVSEIEFLKLLSTNETLKTQFQSGNIIGINHPGNWLAGLIYTPLFSRPVILEMMREWVNQKLSAKKIETKYFAEELDSLIIHQLNILLNSDSVNNSIRENCKDFCNSMPFWGHLAIYSINLLILRAILSDKEFIFEPTLNNDGTSSWEQLTHIWRAWFSIENLNELTAILTTQTRDKNVVIKAKEKFTTESSYERLELIQNVSITLADNVTSNLTQLILEPHKYYNLQSLGSLTPFTLPIKMREILIETRRFDERYFIQFIEEIDYLGQKQELISRQKAYECIGIFISVFNFLVLNKQHRNNEEFYFRYFERSDFPRYFTRLLKRINLEEIKMYYPDIFCQLIDCINTMRIITDRFLGSKLSDKETRFHDLRYYHKEMSYELEEIQRYLHSLSRYPYFLDEY